MLEMKDHKRNYTFSTPLMENIKTKIPYKPAGTVYKLVGTSLYCGHNLHHPVGIGSENGWEESQ